MEGVYRLAVENMKVSRVISCRETAWPSREVVWHHARPCRSRWRRASAQPEDVADHAACAPEFPRPGTRTAPVVAEVQGWVARAPVPGRLSRHEHPVHPDRHGAGRGYVGGVGPARATRGPGGVARSR